MPCDSVNVCLNLFLIFHNVLLCRPMTTACQGVIIIIIIIIMIIIVIIIIAIIIIIIILFFILILPPRVFACVYRTLSLSSLCDSVICYVIVCVCVCMRVGVCV